ncbi:MAG TPA: lysine--tRNA ligase [Caldisericia bacterium]|nr:lysine--tRNA ligase [Caldisericia bacterium]HPI84358.1 lysine--tRNA ligase [Caldisericia bacterium]HPQ93610.1 lysine--tRNA ligase [Caldisericia bacterium]
MFNESMLTKLAKLKEAGIDAYPPRIEGTLSLSNDVKANFEKLEQTQEDVRIGGRITTVRGHGKARFMVLRDEAGPIQLYCRIDVIGEETYDLIKSALDIGDTVIVSGPVFKTRTEEITVEVKTFEWVNKALVELPEKFHGLVDSEIRYRKRHIDMISNPEVLERFTTRNKIIKAIREFLWSKDFEEVETPILQPLYGGALAKPFETHHNALDRDLYMRIAPELYLKRLIVGGMPRIFELGKCFRNEGISTVHNPEFTMLELYQAWESYEGMMRISEELVSDVAKKVLGTTKITYQDKEIELAPPWKRLSMRDAFREMAGIEIDQLRDDAFAKEYVKREGIKMDKKTNFKGFVDEVFKKKIVVNLTQPTFITDYPIELSPLAKMIPGEDGWVERFQFVIFGMECGNAFSELNDPQDQLERFKAQDKYRTSGDDEAHEVDTDYVEALGVGMPPTGGLGIGVDRLVMLLTDQVSIREVLFFPQLRTKEE